MGSVPPPPADVPELPKSEKESAKTIREMLAAHDLVRCFDSVRHVKMRVGALPPKEDPDSFIRKRGAEAFRGLIEQAVRHGVPLLLTTGVVLLLYRFVPARKLGFGDGEFVLATYTCLPVLDAAGTPIPDRGAEMVIATRATSGCRTSRD